MPTPSLRILIVDDHQARCLEIERILNHQGYYRIAPVTSFEQLTVLLDCVVEPFDLLVINSDLAMRAEFNQDYYFKFCPSIKHVLVYEGLPCDEKVHRLCDGTKVIKKLSRPLDNCTMESFMGIIDPKKANLRAGLQAEISPVSIDKAFMHFRVLPGLFFDNEILFVSGAVYVSSSLW